MTRFRLKFGEQILADVQGDPLDAFGDIHRAAGRYDRATPLTIEVWQDSEWRRLYADDEWRGPIAAE